MQKAVESKMSRKMEDRLQVRDHGVTIMGWSRHH
jgi:hypothetical protein